MPTHRIAIVAMQGLQLLKVTGPSDVFAEANRQSGRDCYLMEVVSTSGSLIGGSSGMAPIPDQLMTSWDSSIRCMWQATR